MEWIVIIAPLIIVGASVYFGYKAANFCTRFMLQKPSFVPFVASTVYILTFCLSLIALLFVLSVAVLNPLLKTIDTTSQGAFMGVAFLFMGCVIIAAPVGLIVVIKRSMQYISGRTQKIIAASLAIAWSVVLVIIIMTLADL